VRGAEGELRGERGGRKDDPAGFFALQLAKESLAALRLIGDDRPRNFQLIERGLQDFVHRGRALILRLYERDLIRLLRFPIRQQSFDG
jgi:hypothetical protein